MAWPGDKNALWAVLAHSSGMHWRQLRTGQHGAIMSDYVPDYLKK